MFFEDLFCHVGSVLDLHAVVDSGEYGVKNMMFSCQDIRMFVPKLSHVININFTLLIFFLRDLLCRK